MKRYELKMLGIGFREFLNERFKVLPDRKLEYSEDGKTLFVWLEDDQELLDLGIEYAQCIMAVESK